MTNPFSLFLMFFKIGLFTFGGGYAMLPLIQEEITKRGLMALEDLVNFVAVSESTPGPFAVNIATYVGMHTCGIWGSVLSTLGVVMPSFIVILIVAHFYEKFRTSRYVEGVMSGLRPAVIGMLANAVLNVGSTVFTALNAEAAVSLAIFALSLYLALKKKNPILIILLSAAIGLASMYLMEVL